MAILTLEVKKVDWNVEINDKAKNNVIYVDD